MLGLLSSWTRNNCHEGIFGAEGDESPCRPGAGFAASFGGLARNQSLGFCDALGFCKNRSGAIFAKLSGQGGGPGAAHHFAESVWSRFFLFTSFEVWRRATPLNVGSRKALKFVAVGPEPSLRAFVWLFALGGLWFSLGRCVRMMPSVVV